jgi:hypothetical protein
MSFQDTTFPNPTADVSRSPSFAIKGLAFGGSLRVVYRFAVACLSRSRLEKVGIVLLSLALVGMIISLAKRELIGIKHTWFPVPYMSVDFDMGTYGPSRYWLTGQNPYLVKHGLGGIPTNGEMSAPLVYPPFVLRWFAWCKFLPLWPAYIVMLVGLIVSAVIGAIYSIRSRTQWKDHSIGPFFASAAVLLSAPVLFGLERGNYDLLVVPVLVLGTVLLSRRTPSTEICGGLVLAAAPWLKAYPGLIGISLIATRRWRAFAAYVGMCIFIGIMDLPYVGNWLSINRKFTIDSLNLAKMFPKADVNTWWHSLSQSWEQMLYYVPWPLSYLRQIPGTIAAPVLLLGLLGYVAWRFYKSPNSDRLIFPFMMWVVALGTFLPPIANDYSLVFLPIAAIALWSPKDHWALKLCMLCYIIAWQPIALPINGRVLLAFKVIGLIVTGACLLKRLEETSNSRTHKESPSQDILAQQELRTPILNANLI